MSVRSVGLFLLFGLIASTALGQDGLIPPNRLTIWSPGTHVGVINGIPKNRTNLINVTLAPYLADKTGVNAANGPIQAAINAAKPNDVIYLPAGTYRLEGGLVLQSPGGGGTKTVRGAGSNTVLKAYNNANAFNVGSSAGHDYQPSIVTAGLNKGSSNIVVSNAPWYPVGSLIHLKIPDDTNIFSVYGYSRNRQQQAIIRAITGNSLSIWPPLYDDYPSNTVIEFSQFQINSVGLEDMTIDMANSTQVFAVQFEQTYGCWMKGVTVKNANNYCVFVSECLNFEMRDCVLGPAPNTGSNHSGLLHNSSSGSLIENNIVLNVFPLIEVNFGSSGNVFAYNLFTQGRININHGPHNFLNLYEGNVGVNFQSDGYFGGSSKDTLFRNWFHGNNSGQQEFVGSLNRFTRDYSLVGNIFGCTNFSWSYDGVSLGNPNMGNSSFMGSQSNNAWADLDSNSLPRRWIGRLTSRSSDTAGIITFSADVLNSLTSVNSQSHVGRVFGANFANFVTIGQPSGLTVPISNSSHPLPTNGSVVTLTPSPSGFQELDLDVRNTLLRRGNYNYFDRAVPAAELLGTNTLPVSLYRTVKPSWFGDLNWPPFDPTNPAPSLTAIPAGYRFVNGTNPPGSNVLPPAPPTGFRLK